MIVSRRWRTCTNEKVCDFWQHGTDGKIEKIKLNKWRRIPEKLDIPTDDPARPLERRALQPGTDHTDNDRKEQARDSEFNRHEKAVDHTGPVITVIDKRKVYSRLVI